MVIFVGYEVVGVFMQNWDQTNETGICTAALDRDDAIYTCQKLDISLHETNFVKDVQTCQCKAPTGGAELLREYCLVFSPGSSPESRGTFEKTGRHLQPHFLFS